MNRGRSEVDERTVTRPAPGAKSLPPTRDALLSGKRIAHYEVGARLGAGGMGEVYRATDTALGRAAALKVLPQGFSQALRERLLREAWASAKLQHPSIATFYEAGEHEGVAYIAMEFVEGRTLRDRLRDGSLPVDQAIALTTQLLEALVHAHAADILHRDIKPENIMVTGDGHAKLLDFGLAKHLGESERAATAPLVETYVEPSDPDATVTQHQRSDESSGGLTMAGSILGTYGYMSPEQLQGIPADQRTDLFLIGVVLYEMISGRRAFPGETSKERYAAVLSSDGPLLDGLALPNGLADVIRRSLERGLADRYQTAAEFLGDLRRIGEKDRSSTGWNAKQEAEEWYQRGLREYDRSGKGSFDLAGEHFQCAIAINPDHVPSLVRLAGIHSMRFTYSTDPATLDEGERYARRAMALAPDNGDARAWIGYCLFRREKNTDAALEVLRALEFDPASSLAAYFAATIFSATMPHREALGLQERVTGRACRDDPHLWRREESRELYRRAVGLSPNYGWAWLGFGNACLELSRFEEAARHMQRGIELSRSGANSPSGIEGYLGECKRREGKLEEARRHALAGLQDVEGGDLIYRDTIRGICLCSMGRTALQQGDRPAAKAAFLQAIQQLRGRSRALGAGHMLVQALAGSVQAGEGDASFREAMQHFQTREGFNFSHVWLCRDDVSLFELARAARTLGRIDEAKKLFEASLDHGSVEAANESAAGLWVEITG